MSDKWESYPGVLDNVEWSVGERTAHLASNADVMNVATGYLYASGFDVLSTALDDVEDINLLFGKVGPTAAEQLKQTLINRLNELETTDDNRARVQTLYELAKRDSANIRVYQVSQAAFHPKLYQFKCDSDTSSSGSAVVGSSNLTRGGMENNVELNIEVREQTQLVYLNDWFENRWEEGSELTEELIEDAISESQFSRVVKSDHPAHNSPNPDGVISPFEATVQFIAAHFREEVNSGTFFDDLEGETGEVLTGFQQDAVRVGTTSLDKYGGVIVSDSVGLGKSFIGAGLLHRHKRPTDNALVIAPKRLREKWMNEMLDEDGGAVALPGVDFMTYGKLQTLSESEAREELGQYDFFLIDEAHKLKNRDSEGYKNLVSIGTSERKFILLTATPIHNSVEEFDSIRRIFADEHLMDFSQLAAGLSRIQKNRHLSSISRVFSKYDKLSGDTVDLLEEEERELKQELRKFIQRVIGELVIIRDRTYINRVYPDAKIEGEEISFPDRDPSLVEVDDDAAIELVNELDRNITGGKLLSDEGGLNLPTLRFIDDEESLDASVDSQRVLLMLNLLRRLESSVPAFLDSIKSRIKYTSAIGTLIDPDSPSPERGDAIEYLSDRQSQRAEIDSESIELALNDLSSSDRRRLKRDIESDLESLRGLKSTAETYMNQFEDGKAERLRELLCEDHESDKILVFSEHVPTVNYLFKTLTEESIKGDGIGRLPDGRRIGLVTGSRDNTEQIINQFAPIAQDADVDASNEVDVVLTTEVLAEGHDLQDASAVVNYDLHWNPMRIEQRIGRIDRLDSPHDTIYVYNFEPIGGLENSLELRNRLQKKMEEIASLIGKSNEILEKGEVVDRQVELYKKVQRNDKEYGDEEGLFSSSASDFYTRAREFCEEHSVTLSDLQEALTEREGAMNRRTQVINHNVASGTLIVDFDVYYSSGEVEPRTVAVDSDSIVTDEELFGDGVVIRQYDRIADSPGEVFEYLSSDSKQPYITEMESDQEQFLEELLTPDGVENDFVGREVSGIETTIRYLCTAVIESSDDPNLVDKARDISSLLEDPEMAFTDNSQSTLRGTYNQLKNKTDSDEELLGEMHEFIIESDALEQVETHRVEDVVCRTVGVAE